MSASREKKERKDLTSTGIVDRRTEERRKQEKKDKRTTGMYIGIIAAMIVVFILCSLYNNQNFRKNMTAVTVDGTHYSAAVLDYYYYSAYNNFVNKYGDYLSMVGLDTSKSLKSQNYSDTETWDEYFRDQAVTSLIGTAAVYKKAQEAGFTLTDDQKSQIDDYYKSIESYCTSAGIKFEDYVHDIYGSYVTEDIFKTQTEMSYTAQLYDTQYKNSLTYTDDQINSYYSENSKDIDNVTYELYTADGKAASTTDSSGNTVSATDEQNKAAMSTASDNANAILARVQKGEALKTVANDYDSASYSEKVDQTYSAVSSVSADWLYDASRVKGDSTVIEDTDNSCYYVLVFESRSRYEYNTVNVRHILIAPESTTLSSSDAGYDADVAQKKADAKAKAESILNEYLAGSHTSDAFAALAEKNSSDTGSNTNGGLYENIYKGEMETEFNDWCFDSARQVGDTGIIETSYGYHVMYFDSVGKPYWMVQTEDALRTKDYNAWYSDITTKGVHKSFLGMKCIGGSMPVDSATNSSTTTSGATSGTTAGTTAGTTTGTASGTASSGSVSGTTTDTTSGTSSSTKSSSAS
jgi:parvulin-like peptidyl-prolyl isomerase